MIILSFSKEKAHSITGMGDTFSHIRFETSQLLLSGYCLARTLFPARGLGGRGVVNLGLGSKPNIKLATSRMGERQRRERRSRSELNRVQRRSQVLSPTRRENPGNEVEASDDGGRRPQTSK